MRRARWRCSLPSPLPLPRCRVFLALQLAPQLLRESSEVISQFHGNTLVERSVLVRRYASAATEVLSCQRQSAVLVHRSELWIDVRAHAFTEKPEFSWS